MWAIRALATSDDERGDWLTVPIKSCPDCLTPQQLDDLERNRQRTELDGCHISACLQCGRELRWDPEGIEALEERMPLGLYLGLWKP